MNKKRLLIGLVSLLIFILLMVFINNKYQKFENNQNNISKEDEIPQDIIDAAKGYKVTEYGGAYSIYNSYNASDAVDLSDKNGKTTELELLDALIFGLGQNRKFLDERMLFKGYVVAIKELDKTNHYNTEVTISDTKDDTNNTIEVYFNWYDEQPIHPGDILFGKGMLRYEFDKDYNISNVYINVEFSSEVCFFSEDDDTINYDEKKVEIKGEGLELVTVKGCRSIIGEKLDRPVIKTEGNLYLVDKEYRLYYDIKHFPYDYISLRYRGNNGNDDWLLSEIGKKVTVRGILYSNHKGQIWMYGTRIK
ncbi:hypothetical protein SAMN02910298_02029 [Pseudobutyrivibrio sp. YE44]|uniref:hypothetical protein n=1 Tax=Pseudobutyrivibrio sp. YE44 TaxID=1520802 RepID=UPI000886A855|nr:hypothetical protein [Pseudobutyrivibrio sp. YE44]SDB41095.1 hypothetical protein SAMN02910298_02029 [Pseudobutyrivibrio sp. YE44]